MSKDFSHPNDNNDFEDYPLSEHDNDDEYIINDDLATTIKPQDSPERRFAQTEIQALTAPSQKSGQIPMRSDEKAQLLKILLKTNHQLSNQLNRLIKTRHRHLFATWSLEALQNLNTYLQQALALLKRYAVEDNAEKDRGANEVIKPLRDITPDHLSILRYLAVYKFATTSQLDTYLDLKQPAAKLLHRLQEANLIRSYHYEVERGRASEKCWWLWYGGAKLLQTEFNLNKVSYEVRFSKHPPSRERIRLRTMELELPCQVRNSPGEWSLICPREYNSTHPKPKDGRTPQTEKLLEAVDLMEQQEIHKYKLLGYNIARRIEAYEAGQHLECVPAGANHHLAYLPNSALIVVFILCPLDATSKFWQARLAEYGELVQKVRVVAVFYDHNQARAYLETLNANGFQVATIGKIAEFLTDIS